ncbi:MAG: hypothetical protein KKB79_00625 [Nanoarchaeota archaeon]|nr:hypothetical protein [Nanoarchaeota archaeon]
MILKRGQVSLSFGMIFSIILIVIFFAFAFYAIKTFFGINNSAQVGQFISDFQSDVDKIWRSSGGSQVNEYSLPSGVTKVCFVDFNPDIGKKGINMNLYVELSRIYQGSDNIVFYPMGSTEIGSTKIDNLNLADITLEENPFCINNAEGIKLNLIKEASEALVRVERGN